jgi:3-oxoacyl-[acyl-carrier protein] reductase
MSANGKQNTKKIVITGACSGIGQAISMALGQEDCILGLHSRKEDNSLKKLKKLLTDRGCEVIPIIGDLLDLKFVESMIPDFVNKSGGIDVLVNNAGGVNYDHYSTVEADEFQKTNCLNATVPFLLIRSAFEKMKSNGGRIVNISSISAKYGGSEKSMHYAASKAALESITKSFSRFGAEFNILVNAIRPGLIDTSFHSKHLKTDMKERINLIPLKRMGRPKEIAGLVKYLIGETGAFITGQILEVAGGD